MRWKTNHDGEILVCVSHRASQSPIVALFGADTMPALKPCSRAAGLGADVSISHFLTVEFKSLFGLQPGLLELPLVVHTPPSHGGFDAPAPVQ